MAKRKRSDASDADADERPRTPQASERVADAPVSSEVSPVKDKEGELTASASKRARSERPRTRSHSDADGEPPAAAAGAADPGTAVDGDVSAKRDETDGGAGAGSSPGPSANGGAGASASGDDEGGAKAEDGARAGGGGDGAGDSAGGGATGATSEAQGAGDRLPLRVATVCAANVNRSVAAQVLLQQHGVKCKSYGAGSAVRLPGPRGPVVYPFGTPYGEMLEKVLGRDRAWFERLGVVRMLQRDMQTKRAPARFQDEAKPSEFDIIICFEQRIFDAVVEDISTRDADEFKTIHVVNFDIKDNEDSAAEGARVALKFVQACEKLTDLDSEIAYAIQEVTESSGHEPLYSMHLL